MLPVAPPRGGEGFLRNTKIVATLGPSSQGPDMIRRLVDAGVDVFRLNASHGNAEDRVERIRQVRAVAAELSRHVAILLDLQGPKIRLGRFENGGCHLVEGQPFFLTTDDLVGNASGASTTYADLVKDVKPGDRILLNDGAVELRAQRTDGNRVLCQVVRAGWVGDRKGINLPGVAVSTPALTKKDKFDLLSALEAGIDLVALSFVRRRDDLLRLRHFLEEYDAHLPIVAKIEKPEAWERLDEILEESDGVMVARGDLGVEIALEKVPSIQKSIIERARARGRFVITATQMLESMIESAVPTRAEVSDVANAIYDGTDAVMLSAETSAGKFPVEAVAMMARVVREAEATFEWRRPFQLPTGAGVKHSEVIADAAYRAARTLGAPCIVVFTKTGTSARLIARYRPPIPVVAFTGAPEVARQLQPIYGIHPIVVPDAASTDEMLAVMDRCLLNSGWVETGQTVVFVAGIPIGIPGTTNIMRLQVISAA